MWLFLNLSTVPCHSAIFTGVQGGFVAFTPLDDYLKL